MDATTTLAPLEQSEITKALSRQKSRRIPAGETPFTEEDTLKKFYFILEGRIKISHINFNTTKEQTVNILSRGDMFDVITLLDQQVHHYHAVTLEPTQVMEVPIEEVRRLIESDPNFNRYFFPYLAKQLRGAEDLAVDLSLYDVYERIIRLIGRNLDTRHEEDAQLNLINDLSHEELAALVGTVRKVLNKNLQKLKKEGIIDISRKQLNIKDLEKLFEKLDETS